MNRATLSVVSYNIWFDSHLEIERTTSLIINLREIDSDIICLQEVRQSIYDILIENLPNYKYQYPKYIADMYGCVILSKYPITECLEVDFTNSMMGRSLLIGKIQYTNFNTKSNIDIIIATTHFESIFQNKNTIKIKQYQKTNEILDILHKKYKNVIFCADTNILSHEEKYFIPTDKNSWQDAWKLVGDKKNKFTFDGHTNIYLKEKYKRKYRSRLDRIIYQAENCKIKEFKLVSNINIEMKNSFFCEPSDHFGILGKFDIISLKK